MVRQLHHKLFRTPWTFMKRGEKGHRKIGPFLIEKHQWPGQNDEFPELSPKFQHNNHELLRKYTGVRETGYTDPETGKFVFVPEMVPELVVPDLSNFELKPYVSYKTDVAIEDRIKKFDQLEARYGSEETAIENAKETEIWPPPRMNAKTMFDLFYADRIRKAYKERRDSGKEISLFSSIRSKR